MLTNFNYLLMRKNLQGDNFKLKYNNTYNRTFKNKVILENLLDLSDNETLFNLKYVNSYFYKTIHNNTKRRGLVLIHIDDKRRAINSVILIKINFFI